MLIEVTRNTRDICVQYAEGLGDSEVDAPSIYNTDSMEYFLKLLTSTNGTPALDFFRTTVNEDSQQKPPVQHNTYELMLDSTRRLISLYLRGGSREHLDDTSMTHER
jgi:hypothetical protein